jgi:hypothetical protein
VPVFIAFAAFLLWSSGTSAMLERRGNVTSRGNGTVRVWNGREVNSQAKLIIVRCWHKADLRRSGRHVR